MKMRRLLAVFMTVVMTMGQFRIPVMAEEIMIEDEVTVEDEATVEDKVSEKEEVTVEDDAVSENAAFDPDTDAWLADYDYSVKDGKLHLTAGKDTLTGNIVIPAKGKVSGTEYPVVLGPRSAEDAGGFFGYMNSKITGIRVEKGVALDENASSIFTTLNELETLDVSGLDTSGTVNMGGLFFCNPKLTALDVSGFDTSKVTNMSWMFKDCPKLTQLDLKSFNTSKVENMSWMFDGCTSLETLDVSSFDTSGVTDMESVFNNCKSLEVLNVSAFKTSKVTKADQLFGDCEKLKSLDVSGFDTSNMTDMQNMFARCKSLTSLDVSRFNTSKAENMGGMFTGCVSLNSLDVSKFDTSNVTVMSYMFCGCENLKSIDVSKFNTFAVEDFDGMFWKCKSLNSLDVTGFDTSNAAYMGYMFAECSDLTSLDVSGFRTSKATRMYNMFHLCSSLKSIDVSRFDTSNVQSMWSMFSGCSSLTDLDIRNFKISKDCGINSMTANSAVNLYIPLKGMVTEAITNNYQLKKLYYPGTEEQFKVLDLQLPEGVEVIYNYTEGMAVQSNNPLSPVPLITASTTELYLVKGQKFDLPAGEWKCEAGKILNISKKGIVKAKKVTSEPVVMEKTDGSQKIKVYISEPKLRISDKKDRAYVDGYEHVQISMELDYDREHLPVYWYSSSPDAATVTAGGNVLFSKPGKTTITAYINGKAYKKKVSYSHKYTQPSYSTIHINVGKSKKISVQNFRNPVWTSDSDKLVIDGNKLTAKEAGVYTVTGIMTDTNNNMEFKHIIKVYVEDLSVTGNGITAAGTNKYTLSAKAGDVVKAEFKGVYQPVVLKSSNTKVATVDEDCNITIRAKGKAKITTKINGKTVTINVNSN